MKPSRPVLYELLKEQPRYQNGSGGNGVHTNGHHQPPPPRRVEPIPTDAAPMRVRATLSAGRAIRLPVGYLFVGAAALIIIGAGAYMFGYLSGRDDKSPSDLSAYRAEEESRRLAEQLRDPVQEGSAARPPASGGNSESSRTALSANGAAGTSPADGLRPGNPPGSGGATGPPILSDPRESGYRYFRLTYTTRANALELAGFCRENGLEAYVVPANNGDSCYVYVLPGFTEGDTTTQKRLIEHIEEVRALWHASTNRDDLRSYVAYLKR